MALSSTSTSAALKPEQMNVLITGGSRGIGRELAARFLAAGSQVLVTGRNAATLQQASAALPGLRTLVNDIGQPEERERLAAYVRGQMPGLNVIIHNAGIQRRIPLAADNANWAERQAEIDILFGGPVHLSQLLVPMLLAQPGPSLIVTVTSGGAYLPQPFAPLYSASKAALHSFTVNLRYALTGTQVRVAEIIPPAVNTDLAGPDQHGAAVDNFCEAVFAGLVHSDAAEIGFGFTDSDTFKAPKLLSRAMFGMLYKDLSLQRYSARL